MHTGCQCDEGVPSTCGELYDVQQFEFDAFFKEFLNSMKGRPCYQSEPAETRCDT